MNLLVVLSFLSFSLLLSIILIVFSFFLGKKNPYKNKITSYECGFSPIYQPVNPFSIRFFVIGVIFLIFDLELLYLIPWSCSSISLPLASQWIVFCFFSFIGIGLIYEWKKGGLEWV